MDRFVKVMQECSGRLTVVHRDRNRRHETHGLRFRCLRKNVAVFFDAGGVRQVEIPLNEILDVREEKDEKG